MDQISSIIVGLCLMLIMLGMGLSLTIQDFKNIAKQPKALGAGLVNQLILLPIVGFGIATFLNLPPIIAVGVMILSACPGGATSNLITHLAKGDIALSISLTAAASLVTILSIPFITGFALSHFSGLEQTVEINKLSMISQLFMIVIIPVSIGMLIRAKKTSFAIRMDRPVRIASGLLLLVVIIGIIIKERDNIIPYFIQSGTGVILLNVITLFLGWLAYKVMKLSSKQGLSIMIESGIQNSALAMTIATITIGNTSYGIAAAIYTLVMYASAFLIIMYGRKRLASSS